MLEITLLAASSAACAGEADYVAVASPPVHYDVYPHTYYEGSEVYYIDGRWYRDDGHRWVYYRREPAELYRYRAHVRRAPEAYDAPHHRHYEHGHYEHGHHEHGHHEHERGRHGWDRDRDHGSYTAPPAR